MGFKEWRERQLTKVDALQARADERVVRAEQREVAVREEVAEARAERTAGQVDPVLAWFRSRAALLGEVHEDLVARGSAVGLGDPPVPKRRRGEVLLGIGAMISMDDSMPVQGSDRVDEYEHWRDRIVLAERLQAKVAEGVPLSKADRALAKLSGVPLPK